VCPAQDELLCARKGALKITNQEMSLYIEIQILIILLEILLTLIPDKTVHILGALGTKLCR
jgi:hypothetical protein